MTSLSPEGQDDASLPAPELGVSEWFNTPTAITLASLRGRPDGVLLTNAR